MVHSDAVRCARASRRLLHAYRAIPLLAVLSLPFPARAAWTDIVSIASDGTPIYGACGSPSISADGRFVAFVSTASNLVPGDTNELDDIFVHDRLTGVTERVSIASDGAEANGTSLYPSISADGRFVEFGSTASNLVPDDTNGQNDVFVHDRLTGVTERVSVATNGTQCNAHTGMGVISGDGRYVAFWSAA
jgi:hypothetical protein